MCVIRGASFPFAFDGEMWNLIVLVPDHCLSFLLLTEDKREADLRSDIIFFEEKKQLSHFAPFLSKR